MTTSEKDLVKSITILTEKGMRRRCDGHGLYGRISEAIISCRKVYQLSDDPRLSKGSCKNQFGGELARISMSEPLFPVFENSPYTKLTGIEFTERGEGYSQAVLKITEPVLRLTNGSVHGGAIATLVDVGMGAALLTHIKADEMAATIQLQVNYLAAAWTGALVCDSKIIRKGRKIATAESEVRNEGNLIAKAMATFTIYKSRTA